MMQCLLVVAAAAGLAACAAGPEAGAPGPAAPSARDVLARAAQQGPVPTLIVGQPPGLAAQQRNGLVTEALAEGVRGLTVRFTPAPAEATAGEPRLVVALDPAGPVTGGLLCRSPETISTRPRGDRLQIVAAFCEGGELLSEARVEGPADSERQVERLLWRTAGELFPDDYPERYGFGILPDWLNLGVGGSFGF